MGRPDVKRSMGWPGRRWEDNIEMDLRKMGCDARCWIDLAQDQDEWQAYVMAVINL